METQQGPERPNLSAFLHNQHRRLRAQHRSLLERHHQLLERLQRAAVLREWNQWHATEGVALFEEGRFALANQSFHLLCKERQRWRQTAGQPAGEALWGGRVLASRLVEVCQGLVASLLQARGEGPGEPIEHTYQSEDPDPLHLQVFFRWLSRDQKPRLVVSVRNISSGTALTNERQEARRKDDFLAMLAHELRNPLAPIAAAAELILREPCAPRVVEAALLIQRQVQHQARLVAELLDTARLRHNKLKLELARVDVGAVAREATAAAQATLPAGLTLTLHAPAEPQWAEADPTRLSQCLLNLLTNAVKFTPPPGRIDLSLEAGEDVLWLRVRDTGQGLTPELMEHVFEPFAQGEQSLDRGLGGLGLGLALVHDLMTLHGGGVAVESEGLGRGAQFTLWLPRSAALQAPEQPAAAPGPSRAGAPGRVLVVDDNADICAILALLLQAAGWEVFTAHNGAAGVELALRQRPDVVLSDIGLPVLDGYRLARLIKEKLPGTRLVAMSGYSQPSEQAAAREAGFDCYLVKPAPLPQLLEALAGPGPIAP